MRIRVIDAFTDRPFAGNPAGVCLLEGDTWPDEQWMWRVAAELNLPMTAFAHPLDASREADWALRWFNAVAEDKFCGHATLATAHALHADRGSAGTVRFDTRSGILIARSGEDGAITLDFPTARLGEAPAPDGLVKALGTEPEATYATGELGDVIVVLAEEQEVRQLSPDISAIDEITRRDGIRGVCVTAAAAPESDGYDFVSRFFDPAGGIPEDAATGSVHTALAPYWSARLGRDRLVGVQASARTGRVETEVRGDRVHLTGRAVTVLDGDLLQL
jgi:PhzF family phenazine biosynthesis protein